MVYRDLAMEEAQKRFEQITTTVAKQEAEPMTEVRVGKEKRKRKVVKALVAKS